MDSCLGAASGVSSKPDSSTDDYILTSRHCLWCDYSLRGLEARGRCPECGYKFGDEMVTCESAMQLFNATFSRWTRLGVDAGGERRHSLLRAAVRTLFAAITLSTIYVLLNVGASYAVAHFDAPVYPQRWNGFAEFGAYGTHGTQVHVSLDRLFAITCYVAVQIILLAAMLYTYYRSRLRRSVVSGYGRRLRRIGWHAASTAPAMVWIPILLTGPWQSLNSSSAGGRSEMFFHVSFWSTMPFRSANYAISIPAFLVVLTGLVSCGVLLRKHHRYLNEVIQSIRSHAAPINEPLKESL